MKRLNLTCGYIALISAILISISLLTTVLAVSLFGFFSRFNILESEQKEMSFYLAESCINTAILKFVQNKNYLAASTSVRVGDHLCRIISVTSGTLPSNRLIKTQGKYGDAYTNLEVEVGPEPNYFILTWREVSDFP